MVGWEDENDFWRYAPMEPPTITTKSSKTSSKGKDSSILTIFTDDNDKKIINIIQRQARALITSSILKNIENT